MKEVSFNTERKVQVINLDSYLLNLDLEGDGFLMAFTPHATASLILNEAESGLMKDFEEWVLKNFKGSWRHDRIDDNASAHLASGMLGQFVLMPVKDGRIIRGTWQNLLFIELDGPRSSRRVVFKFKKE
jgi:secondary thiamine-phosphate synthase enzyme